LAFAAGQFFNPQHGDDVLEVFVVRQGFANGLGDLVMRLPTTVGESILEPDWSGSMAGYSPSLARLRESTIEADKWEKM
jgi:hypothetical protein